MLAALVRGRLALCLAFNGPTRVELHDGAKGRVPEEGGHQRSEEAIRVELHDGAGVYATPLRSSSGLTARWRSVSSESTLYPR